jgi:hypothetical protein
MPGRQITFGTGERKGQTIDVPDSGSSGAMRHRIDTDSGPSVETPMETADRESGSNPEQASNAGRQAQSTDHMNQY